MMSSPGDSQTEMIVQTLKKRLHVRADDYHLQNSGDWEGLAGAVAGMESKLKRPKHTVRFDTLLTAWENELSEAIALDQNLAN